MTLCLALVAVGALALALFPATQSTSKHPQDRRELVGKWRLNTVSVDDGAHRIVLPANYGATVAFDADGTLSADDTINGYNAEYTMTPNGIHVTHFSGTLVGYPGNDPMTIASIRGIGTLMTDEVNVRSSHGGLTLRHGHVVAMLTPL